MVKHAQIVRVCLTILSGWCLKVSDADGYLNLAVSNLVDPTYHVFASTDRSRDPVIIYTVSISKNVSCSGKLTPKSKGANFSHS